MSITFDHSVITNLHVELWRTCAWRMTQQFDELLSKRHSSTLDVCRETSCMSWGSSLGFQVYRDFLLTWNCFLIEHKSFLKDISSVLLNYLFVYYYLYYYIHYLLNISDLYYGIFGYYYKAHVYSWLLRLSHQTLTMKSKLTWVFQISGLHVSQTTENISNLLAQQAFSPRIIRSPPLDELISPPSRTDSHKTSAN